MNLAFRMDCCGIPETTLGNSDMDYQSRDVLIRVAKGSMRFMALCLSRDEDKYTVVESFKGPSPNGLQVCILDPP